MNAAELVGNFDWGQAFGTGVGVTAAGGFILVLGRLAIWSQWQLIKAETSRSERLADRVDHVEEKNLALENRNSELWATIGRAEQAHRQCERELSEHKLDAERQLSQMQTRLEALERQIDRPYRRDDPPPPER